MIPSTVRLFLLSTFALIAASAQAATLPVREVTVFKDGHAFLLREGWMPVDSNGSVVLDELPIPELGTFFPFSGDKSIPLTSTTMNRRRSTWKLPVTS